MCNMGVDASEPTRESKGSGIKKSWNMVIWRLCAANDPTCRRASKGKVSREKKPWQGKAPECPCHAKLLSLLGVVRTARGTLGWALRNALDQSSQ